MYQTTFDSHIGVPAGTGSPQPGSLLEKIRDRLTQALRFRPAGISKTDHPRTFIDPRTFMEEYLLDDVMGPEIRRTLRI